MAILPILQYPDERLKQTSAPIAAIDRTITRLIDDLLETLYDSPGCVGIASPQVGALHRMVIVDASRNAKSGDNHGRMILLNPEILSSEGEVMAREGCLSLPHLTANVQRAQHIKVKAQNEKGEWWEFDASNFEARVVLHEMDHLDGLLFLDRVASLKTDVFRRKRYTVPDEKTSQAQDINSQTQDQSSKTQDKTSQSHEQVSQKQEPASYS